MSPQMPEETPGQDGPAEPQALALRRIQERQHRERQDPEDEVPWVDGDVHLADHEHRVDPESIGGHVEAAGERG